MRNKVVVLVVLVVLAILAITGSIYEQRGKSGSVSILLPPVTGKASILFNGKLLSSRTTDSYVYDLRSGKYNLVISDIGYKDFLADFSLKNGQTILVNVNLQPLKKPSAADLGKIVFNAEGYNNLSTLSDQFAKGSTATARYFANSTWAIVTVHIPTGLGLAYFIDKYDTTSGEWVAVTSPSDDIQVDNLQSLPIDLQKYLINNGLVNNGAD